MGTMLEDLLLDERVLDALELEADLGVDGRMLEEVDLRANPVVEALLLDEPTLEEAETAEDEDEDDISSLM